MRFFRLKSPSRAVPLHRVVFIALIAATLILGVWGWYGIHIARLGNVPVALDRSIFMAIRALTLADVYTNPESWNWDWRILAAGWLGTIASFWGLLLAGRALFRERLTRFAARRSRDHLVVVGDHPLAEALTALSREKTVRVTFREGQAEEQDGKIVLPSKRLDLSSLDDSGLGRASRVAVALGDDSETAEIAFHIARHYKQPLVIAHMADPWLAQRLHHVPDGARLYVFSEAQMAAREIVRRHPPYLLAMSRKAPRIHAVILGCDAFGEAVACEIALSCCVTSLERPKITILDPDARASEARFFARYPYAAEAADIGFAHVDLDSFDLGADEVGPEPVTAAFICLREAGQAMSAAVALKERALREALFDAPLFVRARSAGGLQRLQPTGHLAPGCPLIPFGGIAEITAATGVLSGDPDAVPRAWHAAYLSFQKKGEGSATPWESLSEEYRVASRRAVAHIPAKLASAGFDLEPWLNTSENLEALPALAPGQNIFRDEAELNALGALEHVRWMADRHFNGWRYAPERDNRRKHHNDLVPFSDLSAEIQGYDTKLILFLDQFLPRRAGGLTRGA